MSGLEFYAHLAGRGEVLEVGIGSESAAWEVALGPDYLDDHARGLLRRDDGLVELSFQQEGDTWSCFGAVPRRTACCGVWPQCRALRGTPMACSLAGCVSTSCEM
ncbi:hypothetical protein ACFVH6_32320 [Spirillospora sp. NPDC127200]